MTKTYDPRELKISIAGVPIEGFGDGEFIEVERSTPAQARERWSVRLDLTACDVEANRKALLQLGEHARQQLRERYGRYGWSYVLGLIGFLHDPP